MILSLMVVVAAALGGTQSDSFEWKEVVPAGHTLEVRGIIGSIRAVAGSGREVAVVGKKQRGERGDPAEVEVRVLREGSRIVLCTIYPRDDRWNNQESREPSGDACEQAQQRAPRVREGNDTRIDFDVRVPAGVHFVGQTVTAGVVLSGLRANAEAYSVAGDVSISDVRGSVVDAASISGDIVFDRVDASQVYAGTLSGDVRFTGSVHRQGDYSFLSYTGELSVNLPASAGVTLSVISPKDGLHSSVALAPISSSSRRRYSGRQGNGSARMSLTTLNGEVTIRGSE